MDLGSSILYIAVAGSRAGMTSRIQSRYAECLTMFATTAARLMIGPRSQLLQGARLD